ncbi:MAG: hypothetical protein MJ053_04835 [Elusimicrobiaceae bacterium]|nr:hypothetical protein [Elusimicrobiaceae bacterium]
MGIIKKGCLLLFLLGVTVGCYAQGKSVVEGGVSAASHSTKVLPEAAFQHIRRAMQKCNLSSPLIMQPLQITNLPGSPEIPLFSHMPVSSSILQARTLTTKEVSQKIFSHYWTDVYVPVSFASDEVALYRGMELDYLTDIQHILQNGLECNKSRYEGIFFSCSLEMALGYTTGKYRALPVLVRVPVTADMSGTFKSYFNDEYIFLQDVPADRISDVVVFLEVDGQVGWYKVVLKDGNLALESIPNRLFKVADLKVPYFDVDLFYPSRPGNMRK